MTNAKFASEGFGQHFPWLDLVNSEQWDGFGRSTDHLLNAGWLRAFLRHWRFDPRDGGAAGYKELAQLRATMRRLGERIAAGDSLRTEDVAPLNRILKVSSYQQIQLKGGLLRTEAVPVHGDWSWIRSRIVTSFAEMMARGLQNRLKICPNSGCRWVFYDRTKANSRKWCNDKKCGNRDRVRRARAKGL
jgi:predicted RNA-binding Zn ribbon-like protein